MLDIARFSDMWVFSIDLMLKCYSIHVCVAYLGLAPGGYFESSSYDILVAATCIIWKANLQMYHKNLCESHTNVRVNRPLSR